MIASPAPTPSTHGSGQALLAPQDRFSCVDTPLDSRDKL